MASLSVLVKNVLNLVYPVNCGVCKKSMDASDAAGVCAGCLSELDRNPMPQCAVCGRGMDNADRICGVCLKARPSFTAARSVLLYEGAVKELVRVFKYGNGRSLAAPLGDMMTDLLEKEGRLIRDVRLVTFVPMHRASIYERGFNQSELLARRISARSGLPVARLLEKVRRTRRQNELPREERLRNLKDAFRPYPECAGKLDGATVLIVDDVMTTGATLDECGRVLVEAGAGEVRCITLARGI